MRDLPLYQPVITTCDAEQLMLQAKHAPWYVDPAVYAIDQGILTFQLMMNALTSWPYSVEKVMGFTPSPSSAFRVRMVEATPFGDFSIEVHAARWRYSPLWHRKSLEVVVIGPDLAIQDPELGDTLCRFFEESFAFPKPAYRRSGPATPYYPNRP